MALAGGVGAAKLLRGIVKVAPEEDVIAIVNTGDDIELHGLYICPDLDIITYTLAGIVDEVKGWGVKDDTFHCLEVLKRYGYETWFNLGDRDLATHIYRTHLLRMGYSLSQVTDEIRKALGVKARILPMSNDKVRTMIMTPIGRLNFQEYLVKRGAKDEVLGVEFEGVNVAKPAPGALEAMERADVIIVCPSNPIVSIGPILAIKGVRETLMETKANVVAISPIVGGAPLKGPADKLMRGLGLEVSAYGVASLYRDFIDAFVMDSVDEAQRKHVEALGLRVFVTNTVMRSLEDSIGLAEEILSMIKGLKQ